MIKAIYVLIILFAFQIGNAQSLESSLKEGIKQYELGRYYNAIPEFDRAIQSNPNNIYAYIYRSLSKINTIGYKDEAYSDLMIAKELDNELASKIINKIGIERFNDIEKAAQECQFIATNSDNPRRDVINGSCYFQRGMNFYNNADYSKAIDNFEGAIIHPDLKAKAFYYVGKSYIGLGKQQLRSKGDEKYACDRFRFSFTDGFKKAIELDSTNIKYYLGANEAKILEYQNCSVNTLSIVHLRLNYMNKILEINPNHEFAIQTKNELLISLKNEEEKERLKKIADAKQAIADAKQAKIN
ncbi:MAG: hypothetical protein NTW25_11830, partial [Candidatus Kapabacteria bacterium]|nr:hypothetical protein [Candidatus Kapabacteria bacterium]